LDVALVDGKGSSAVRRVPSPDESIVQVLHRTSPSATAVRVTAGKDGKTHDEHDLDFSPDGKSLATSCTFDPMIRLFRIEGQGERRQRRGPPR